MKKIKTIKCRMCPTKDAVLVDAGCVFVSPKEYKGKPFTYTFTNELLDRDKINQTKSRFIVQNRIDGKINEEATARYAASMQLGDIFPAIVLFADEEGDLLKADGNHTDEAMSRVGVEIIEGVYYFSHPDPIEISGRFNTRTNGVGESLADTLEKAARLYNKQKLEAEEAGIDPIAQNKWAAQYRISEENFNRYLRVTETKKWVARNSIKVDSIRHNSSFEEIGRVRNIDEQAAIKIAEMAATFELAGKDVTGVVTDWMDPSKNFEDKNDYLKTIYSRFQRQTNNGKQNHARKSRKRPIESLIKESMIKLSTMNKKADLGKLKKLLADKQLAEAANELANFIKTLLK